MKLLIFLVLTILALATLCALGFYSLLTSLIGLAFVGIIAKIIAGVLSVIVWIVVVLVLWLLIVGGIMGH